jgi:hypothetical protein
MIMEVGVDVLWHGDGECPLVGTLPRPTPPEIMVVQN